MKTMTLLLCVLFPVIAMSQTTGTLKGKVFDKDSKKELTLVKIVLEKDSIKIAATSSDKKGIYVIKGIKPGKYDVKASIAGYKEVLVRGVQMNANQTRFLDFEMNLAATGMEEIIIIDNMVPLNDKDKTACGGTVIQEKTNKTRGLNSCE
jgi:hypothetical protein